jgi:hypothetical protein
VDGFDGELPPKEAIREIRINRNPFSAEYSEPGFSRIEILTRPGFETYRGSASFEFEDEALNARNAFAPTRAPLQIREFSGRFGGPIIEKKASFWVNVERQATDENDVVRATVLDPITLAPTPFSTTVLTPDRSFRFNLRGDTQLTANNTFTLHYAFSDSDQENRGIGNFNLPEHGFTTGSRHHELRGSLSSIINGRIVNELRMRLSRQQSLTESASEAQAIVVLDAFTGGGAQSFNRRESDRAEVVENLSLALGPHAVNSPGSLKRIGGRART